MRHSTLAIISFLFLTGCKVGPDYSPPCVFLPESYNEDKEDKTEYIEDEELNHWWCVFNDPFLDYLLDLALSENFDYKIALERVYQARASYWVQFTQILPELDGAGTASRYRTSQTFSNGAPLIPLSLPNISPIRNFFQIGLDAIWEIDLFGKLRRSADASYDLWEASEDEMRGIKITILSEVANTYATICSYQRQREIAMEFIQIDEEFFFLSQAKFEAGLVNEQQVAISLAALEGDRAQLTIIQTALKQSIYSLGVLLGTLPQFIFDEFQIERPIPHSEEKIPIAIPSEVLRRRPDIRNAERQLAAATEQIGVAVANLFPSISLSGSSSSYAANPLQGANMGFSSDSLSKLFLPSSLIWGIGGFVTAPLFDFGKRTANIDVQTSLRNQAYYSYQQTIIAALQETEQALAAYFNEEMRKESLEKEAQINLKNFSLATDLFESGLTDYAQVLQAKEIWLASLNTLTQSQQLLTTDLIAIYKALGGDWQ